MGKHPVKYRYAPADNRTPMQHHTIGFLEYGRVYTHPDCEGNPDFKPIEDEKNVEADVTSVAKVADPTAETASDAAHTGRSNK